MGRRKRTKTRKLKGGGFFSNLLSKPGLAIYAKNVGRPIPKSVKKSKLKKALDKSGFTIKDLHRLATPSKSSPGKSSPTKKIISKRRRYTKRSPPSPRLAFDPKKYSFDEIDLFKKSLSKNLDLYKSSAGISN